LDGGLLKDASEAKTQRRGKTRREEWEEATTHTIKVDNEIYNEYTYTCRRYETLFVRKL
jgi:hypothetical protein